MLTIYSIPKPFTGLFKIIQTNAIRSWLELTRDIVLFGQENGVAAIASKFNLTHIPQIMTNTYDTPILADAVKKIPQVSKNKIISYVNCDIILLADFLEAIKKIYQQNYLIVGQRRPLEIEKQVVGSKNWQKMIKKMLDAQKSRPISGGADYFIYPRNLHFPMPPFAVGKLFWDSWFIYYARSIGIPVINATSVINAIHQQHYRGFEKHAYGELRLGEEAQINLRLLGGRAYSLKVFDADYLLTKKGLVKLKLTTLRQIRCGEIWLLIAAQKHRVWQPLLWLVEKARYLVVSIKLYF